MKATWSPRDLGRSKTKRGERSSKKDASGKSSRKPKQIVSAPKKTKVSAILKRMNARSMDIRKKKRLQYSQSDVRRAIDAYNNQGISLRKAARMFGVPVSTLSRRKVNPEYKQNLGPATILKLDEKTNIVDWIIHRAKIGAPVTKTELLDGVQTYVLTTRRATPFTDSRPGRHWHEGFRKRHPTISTRIAQDLTIARATVYQEDLIEWFRIVGEYLQVGDLLNLPPKRYFNCEETYVPFCTKSAKVLAEQGMPNVHRVVNQNEREGLTVLFTYGSDGTRAPPMVLYPLKETIPEDITANFPSEWGIGNTDNGWMTSVSFYEYVTNVFHPWLEKHSIERPVVLFLDGHSSHATKPLVDFCKNHKIELILLPPHATHVMQPLDVSFFEPFKKFWANQLPRWKVDKKVSRLTKVNFPLALRDILSKFDDKTMIQHGFEACGLYPWNAEAVNYDVLNKRKKKKGGVANSHQDPLASEPAQNSDVPALQILRVFEDTLDGNLLQKFKQAELDGEWTGDETQKGLFEHWMKMKNRILEQNNYPEQVSANNSRQDDGFCPQQDPVVVMNTNENGTITFDYINEVDESMTNQLLLAADLSKFRSDSNQTFDVDSLNFEDCQIDIDVKKIVTEENRVSIQDNTQDINHEKVDIAKKIGSHSLLPDSEMKKSCLSEDINANVSTNECYSISANNLESKKHTAHPSGLIADKYESALVSNENCAKRNPSTKSPTKSPAKSPTKSPIKLKPKAHEKENQNTMPKNNDATDHRESFKEAFVFPEEFLPKKEKLKLEKGKRNKRHPVATSDVWNAEYEKKEAMKKEAEQRLAEKKALQAMKKKLAEERKKLDEKIKALTPKKIKKEKND